MSKIIKLREDMPGLKWFLKVVARVIIISLITLHVIPFLLMFVRGCTYLTMPHSYIHVLSTPKLGTEKTKKALDYFNSLSYYKPVKYEGGYRPIFIVEKPLGPGLLGFASPLPLYCLIVLNEDMDAELLESTIIHEFVHCFNYDHVNNSRDLMYPYNNYWKVPEDNVKHYAEEIGKIIAN